MVAVIDVKSCKTDGHSILCRFLRRDIAAAPQPPDIQHRQGSQLTSKRFTVVFKALSIAISMDGRAGLEWLWRSAKYEDVNLTDYSNTLGLIEGLM